MSTTNENFPAPGEVFEERYRIERLIGSGGFSRVYLATQTDLGRQVALKVMLAEKKVTSATGEESDRDAALLTERFLQEARVVSNLRGSHTVTVHDHGRTADGQLFMVLEYVDGQTLSRVVRNEGALAPHRVAHILQQTLESLHEAHLLGLLHRDIKPANIMLYEHLGRPDNVKVLDFGIAKVVGQETEGLRDDLTKSGSILGTPRYMSPEQLRGEPVGPPSDIYSLGLVAFEMLLGRRAIESNSTIVVIGQQLDPAPFAIPDIDAIPVRLRMVVNKMLAKSPAERYQTAAEVTSDLDLALAEMAQLSPQLRSFTPTPIGITMPDDLPDISDSLEVMDVEQKHAEHSARAAESVKGQKNWLMPAAVVFLCFSLGVLGVVLLSKTTDETVEATEHPTAGETNLAGNNNDTAPTTATQTVAVAQVEKPTPDKPAEPDKPAITQILINTGMTAAEIFVAGTSKGPGPVMLDTEGLEFPLEIKAVTKSGDERVTVLDSPIRRVDIDMSMFEKPEKVVTKKVTKSTGTKKNTGTTTKKVDPEPKEEKTSTLTLPALD